MKREQLDTTALVDHLRSVHDQRLEHLRRAEPAKLHYFAPYLSAEPQCHEPGCPCNGTEVRQ